MPGRCYKFWQLSAGYFNEQHKFPDILTFLKNIIKFIQATSKQKTPICHSVELISFSSKNTLTVKKIDRAKRANSMRFCREIYLCFWNQSCRNSMIILITLATMVMSPDITTQTDLTSHILSSSGLVFIQFFSLSYFGLSEFGSLLISRDL